MIGTEEAVQEAQKELEELIKSLVSLRSMEEGFYFSTYAKITCLLFIGQRH